MKRIPGVKHYRALNQGFRSLGTGSSIQGLAMDAAQRGVNAARTYDPKGQYEAQRRPVRSGWNHELRSGASVVQIYGGPLAHKHMIMADVVLAMERIT